MILRCFHHKNVNDRLLLLPVVPDILHIVVFLEQFDELLHVADVLLVGELDVLLNKNKQK